MTEAQEGGLQLSQMISALRDELEQAQLNSEEADLRFGISGVELEATVQVSKEWEGRGGVKFWVIEAGGSRTQGNSTSQRIKLDLTVPKDTRIADPKGNVQ
ncbi:hypothetical protein SAMN04487983_10775 [Streptomyces sp. yr375]|uniref:trypco2 family protein n=1 Tax=Streptomyces sp. yr375 TaxID=1761906 RepID=UPI0008C1CCE6|nr:trypco2 family protein [Streptomyces sp. yr375]SES49228.1 hypothetical protein SAMN04487983_10775 [Streptomyces sp. yr375]